MSDVRTVPEWIGKNADEAVPPRVRLRAFDRAKGCCQMCTRKIATGERWVADHIKAIINGGENREKNLQMICDWCDRKVKTPADSGEKSKTYEKRAAHLGLRKAKGRAIPGTKASGVRHHMDGSVSCRKTGRILKRPTHA